MNNFTILGTQGCYFKLLKILIALLLVSLVAGQYYNISRTDASGSNQDIVFKDPTDDASNKLRLELSFKTVLSFDYNMGFSAICATHDAGTSLTDYDNHPACYISNLFGENAGCNPSQSAYLSFVMAGK